MEVGGRFGDDPADAEPLERHGGEDAHLQAARVGDHDRVELPQPELFQRGGIGDVRLDRVRDVLRELLDDPLIGVDRQHVVAEPGASGEPEQRK